MEERNGPAAPNAAPAPPTSVAFVPTAAPQGAAPAPSSSTAPAPSAKVAAGIPGAQTNLPGSGVGPEGIGGALAGGPYKQSYTRNFEVDRVTEKTIQVSGKVVRISVAVLVDGVKRDGGVVPRDKEEMEKLSELVKSAVGFNAARGDALHIESSAFSTTEAEEPAPEVVAAVSPRMAKARTYAPIAGVVAALLAVGYVVRRSRKKKATVSAEIVTPEPPIFQLEHSTMAPAKQLAPGDVEALRKEALDIAVKDPATAANVLRAWLHAQTVA
jgi:flagellar M-ring protein FliF